MRARQQAPRCLEGGGQHPPLPTNTEILGRQYSGARHPLLANQQALRCLGMTDGLAKGCRLIPSGCVSL